VRCIAVAWLAIAAALSSGCLVVSLQPAYDADSVVFDEALIGQWENRDDGSKATVDRGEWRSYKVTYVDRFATRSFQGNLTKIETTTYLDLTEMRGVDPGPYLVPVHAVWRVAIQGATLTAEPLDYGWFMRAIAEKTITRLTVAVDDRRNAVIAAPTADLRRWLTSPPEEAFDTPVTFARLR